MNRNRFREIRIVYVWKKSNFARFIVRKIKEKSAAKKSDVKQFTLCAPANKCQKSDGLLLQKHCLYLHVLLQII